MHNHRFCPLPSRSHSRSLRVLDHARRNVDSDYTCAASRHLTREIAVAATNVEHAHSANVTTQRQLRGTEELVSVVVASRRLTLCIHTDRVIP